MLVLCILNENNNNLFLQNLNIQGQIKIENFAFKLLKRFTIFKNK